MLTLKTIVKCLLSSWPKEIYFALKNLVLSRVAGFSMGQACPSLRGSEFFGSA